MALTVADLTAIKTLLGSSLDERFIAEREHTKKLIKSGIETAFDDFAIIIAQDFARIDQRFEHLETDVAELKSDVATLKGDVAELKHDTSITRVDISDLKLDMRDVKWHLADTRHPA